MTDQLRSSNGWWISEREANRLRAIEAAARQLVASNHGQSTGTVMGPDLPPDNWRWYVSGSALDSLRKALEATND